MINFSKALRWKILAIALIAIFAVSTGILAYRVSNTPSSTVSAQTPDFLNVQISGAKTLGVGEIGTYVASVNNSASNNLSYSWSVTPSGNYTVLASDGSTCNLTFVSATTEPCMLSISVKDNVIGNLGYASIQVYDPYTEPNINVNNVADYSYMIETDGLGWYQAINGTDSSICWTSTNQNTVTLDVFGAVTSGTVVFNNLQFDQSLISSIPSGVTVEQEYGGSPTLYWNNAGAINTVNSPTGNNAIWVESESSTTNYANIITTLAANKIRFAILYVGGWNATTPSAPTINHAHTNAFYSAMCQAFYAAGITPIAWAENGGAYGASGTPDVTSANYAAYNAAVGTCVSLGFGGFSDDIEGSGGGVGYTGTVANWISYQNQQATYLHNLGKLAMPAVPCNTGGGSYNSQLHVDYILSLFYWTTSLFEQGSDAPTYWQENFGLGSYNAAFGSPASPVILGILGGTANTNPLSWQLAQFSQDLSLYGSTNLAGIGLFSYERLNATDFDAWRSWSVYGSTSQPFGSSSTLTQTVKVGQAVTVGQVLFQNSSGYFLANALTSSTLPSQGVFGIATQNASINTNCIIVTSGYIQLSSWGLTVGPYWVSNSTAGAMQTSAPIGTGQQSEEIFQATSTTGGFFSPKGVIGQ